MADHGRTREPAARGSASGHTSSPSIRVTPAERSRLMCSAHAGWRACAALIRRKTTIGTVATDSQRVVNAWLSAIPSDSFAVLFEVSGAAT